jgi:RNA polymerase sigma-70 factor, ECF subfamily
MEVLSIAAPRPLDPESVRWLDDLRGAGCAAAVRRLHAFLLRASRGEVARRRSRLPFGGRELDDVADQAADDALLAILAKLDGFRGESLFTTWAARFAVLEVSNKLGRHFWRGGVVGLDPEALERLPDRTGTGPGGEAESHELFAALRIAVAAELTPHQRHVFEALVLNEIPVADLAAEMGTNRGALYKTLFDARRKLRAALDAQGLAADLPAAA